MDWWTQWIGFQFWIFFPVGVYRVFSIGGLRVFTTLLYVVLNNRCWKLFFLEAFEQFCSSFLSVWHSPCEYFSVTNILRVSVYLGLAMIFCCAFLHLGSQFGVNLVVLLFHCWFSRWNTLCPCRFIHIDASSMHCCSINAIKFVIWDKHGPISSILLILWRSPRSSYNISFNAFTATPP